MGRRGRDWIQLALLLLTILGVAVHVESRLARIEQHLVDADRDNASMQERLGRIEEKLLRR